MTIKLLAPDKEMVDRMLRGCAHYNLKAKHNNRTRPYVHVEINSEDDATNVFWLGANLSHPQVDTDILKSSY